MNAAETTRPVGAPALRAIDHIEFYVGNAPQAAHYFRTALGFSPIAVASLETGSRDRVSHVVAQGDVRIVLTSALTPESPIAEHVRLHGDSVRDVAFLVDDAGETFEALVGRGARAVALPREDEDEGGRAVRAAVAAFGDTIHSLVERRDYDGAFLPGYRAATSAVPARGAGIAAVDHVAVCVGPGELTEWIDAYKRVFGFVESHQEDIVTERSAMNSKVVENVSGTIRFPIQEPAPAAAKSQIDEYLEYHGGAGAQHVAFLSHDIAATVRAFRGTGIEFLETPGTYYDALPARVGEIDEEVETLRELGILVDRDASGYLLQVFTKPLFGRPSGFLEVVQRKGAKGFGGGNIRALFEAIEREQARRGNL